MEERKRSKINHVALSLALGVFTLPTVAQEILPFPPTPSASTAGVTMKKSIHKKRVTPPRLQPGAPNVLFVLIDDCGPGVASTFGGEVNTPTLDRLANKGIAYNRFHSTAMSSPTRSALLTGRNHTRIGNGQISEYANDWDGFSGVIPKSSATIAEVLKNYGYRTAGFGKWHNTPSDQTTSKGPFDCWPSGYGFEYFYGFHGGSASQYEPRLVRNNTILEHAPKTSGGHNYYHLTEDITDEAIHWLREQQAFAPDKPFFIYWSSGGVHGPHHVMKEWADKYKGKFDDGWDKYRERVFAKAKAKGWIPQNTKLTPRPDDMASWESIPENEKPFQRRLMEVWAGFTEHTDYNVGRLIDEIEAQGKLDNTIVIYILGDNGSSAEGQNGTISELLAENGIVTTVDQHIKELDKLGGLNTLGTSKTDNMFNAGWAWAGSTPYKGTKLMGAYFGGTRQNMVISWPAKIKHDNTPRQQFHHVIDIVPTIYEAAEITPPRIVNGIEQTTIDGISLMYTFADVKAKERRMTQYFDIMGSRGIYNDGWFASTFGFRTPWLPGMPPSIDDWDPEKDKWELYNLNDDWSQANDLADKNKDKLEQMKNLFLVESTKNLNLPIGGGFWSTPILHPEDAPKTPYTSWTFSGSITGMPELTAPKIGKVDNTVIMDVTVPQNANGVLYAIGGFSGGLTCFVKDGFLNYEYNSFMLSRTKIKSKEKLPTGKIKIIVEEKLITQKPGSPLNVTLKVNDKIVAQGQVPAAVHLFNFSDGLDIGIDLGSPVSADYFDAKPFKFNGDIWMTKISYPEK